MTLGVGKGGQGVLPLDLKFWYFAINVLVEKCFIRSEKLGTKHRENICYIQNVPRA